jgi:Ala-tRNA(Pro) deacylase
MDIYQFLDDHAIPYDRHDHPPVFTCEEAERLAPPLPESAAKTKNLFLRDRKGRRHFLVTVRATKRVDVKALEPLLESTKLSFASPRRLHHYLGLTPGSVTLLGVLNDPDHAVEVVIDADVWQAEAIRCHPLVNTSTLVIPLAHLRRFFDATGHAARVLNVPARETG